MRPGFTYKGTKRSMAYNILNNGMKIEEAAKITGAKQETVKRWLEKYGPDVVTPICQMTDEQLTARIAELDKICPDLIDPNIDSTYANRMLIEHNVTEKWSKLI